METPNKLTAPSRRSPSPRRKSSNSNFDILNPDSIYEITNYLSPKDITNLSLTSKKVKDATDMKFLNMLRIRQKRDDEIIKKIPYFKDFQDNNGLINFKDAFSDNLLNYDEEVVINIIKNLLIILFKYSDKTYGIPEHLQNNIIPIINNLVITPEILFNYYFEIYPQNTYVESFIQNLIIDYYTNKDDDLILLYTAFISKNLNFKNKFIDYVDNIDRFFIDNNFNVINERINYILFPQFIYDYIYGFYMSKSRKVTNVLKRLLYEIQEYYMYDPDEDEIDPFFKIIENNNSILIKPLCNLYIRLQQQIPDSIKNYMQLHNIQFNLEDVDEDLVNKVKPVTNEEIENDEEEIGYESESVGSDYE
jgi:hypothetical protein